MATEAKDMGVGYRTRNYSGDICDTSISPRKAQILCNLVSRQQNQPITAACVSPVLCVGIITSIDFETERQLLELLTITCRNHGQHDVGVKRRPPLIDSRTNRDKALSTNQMHQIIFLISATQQHKTPLKA